MLKRKEEHLAKKKNKKIKEEKCSHIKLSMIFFLGWRNLMSNRTRSILTIGGVALGIGIISFLLAAGFGIQGMIIADVTKNNPRDILDLNNGSLDNFVVLNDDFLGKITSINGVEKAGRQLNTGIKIGFESSQTDAILYGIDRNFLDLAKIEFRKTNTRYEDDQPHAIVSSQLAKLLGFDSQEEILNKNVTYELTVSKEISSEGTDEEKKYSDNTVLVVGLVEDDSSYLYMPLNYLNNSFKVNMAQSGKVLVSDLDLVKQVETDIQHLGFLTESINDVIEDINSFFIIIRAILIVLGVIIISISAMGMLNTLTVSLLQRTKEVGILKALGAKRSDIFKMFIFEAVIISLVGGLSGIISGYGTALLTNLGLIHFASKNGVSLSSFVYIPSYFIISLAVFILFLGVVTGLLPAQRGAKIHALDALRYE